MYQTLKELRADIANFIHLKAACVGMMELCYRNHAGVVKTGLLAVEDVHELCMNPVLGDAYILLQNTPEGVVVEDVFKPGEVI